MTWVLVLMLALPGPDDQQIWIKQVGGMENREQCVNAGNRIVATFQGRLMFADCYTSEKEEGNGTS